MEPFKTKLNIQHINAFRKLIVTERSFFYSFTIKLKCTYYLQTFQILKMIKQASFLLSVIALMLLGSCSDDLENVASITDTLFEIHTVDEISGKNTEDGILMDYKVVAKDEYDVILELSINDKKFKAQLNYDVLSVQYDGFGNSFNAEELSAMDKTLNKIGEAIVEENTDIDWNTDISMVENSLVTVLSHLSNAPVNYPIKSRSISGDTDRALGNDGISCVSKGNWYTIQWDDDQNENTYTFSKQVNGDGGPRNIKCIGRCGGGCKPWWAWWAIWSKDCFEHDWCYSYLNVGTGGGDPSCGDEWWQASDDYIFGFLHGCFG